MNTPKPCERCGEQDRIPKERFCMACKKIIKQAAPRDPKNELPATRPREQHDRKVKIIHSIDNPDELA